MREENDRKQRILTDKGGRMKIEIKRWDNEEVIVSGEYGSFKEAVEQNKEKLSFADLSCADLSFANLSCANLRFADLSCADLSFANLSYADLRSADLNSAIHKEPLFLPDLYSLKLLPKNTKLRYWKYMKNGKSPYYKSEYIVGKTYTCKDYSSDEYSECDRGFNVATIQWCLNDGRSADEFLQVEFKVSDIVAIPLTSHGKFRVKRMKIIKKYTRKQVLDLLKKAMETG